MLIDCTEVDCLKEIVESGMATQEQAGHAYSIYTILRRNGKPVSLRQMLVAEGLITDEQWRRAELKLGVERIIETPAGHFRLILKLGQGGMGEVHLAEDPVTHQRVAIKMISPRDSGAEEALLRFHREMKTAAGLDHVNLVRVIATGRHGQRHYYAMEYCEGETLDCMLLHQKTLRIDQSLEIAIQATRGLRYLHAHGIVHRDIKPQNIFLTREGIAKIFDLGLCKAMKYSEHVFQTQSGVILGTPHYMSPEQIRTERTIDGRADIYSLGATLYHLITGWPPFDGDTCLSIAVKHVTEQLPNPHDLRSGIPNSLVCVVRRMMAKAPQDRYGDCSELLVDLERIASGREPATKELEAGKSNVAMPSVAV